MEEGRNKREAERLDAAFSLNYTIEKPFDLRISLGIPDEAGGLMKDLSDLGAAIITQHDIPSGTQLRLKFNLLNLRLTGEKRLRRIELIAEVMSSLVLPDDSHRLGVRFEKISDEDKSAIREYVSRRGNVSGKD